jgi:copper chaperone CopZ
MLPRLLLLAIAACTARAEFLHVEVFMKDMNCPSCSESLGKAFERLRGVKHVEVSMNDGTVVLDLADQTESRSNRSGTRSSASDSRRETQE